MFPSLWKFFLVGVLSMECLRSSTARRKLIIITGRSNSTFAAITQADPEEYRIQEHNETEQWINMTKESTKRIQRRERGEL